MNFALDYIKKHSTLSWAEGFLRDLKRAHISWERYDYNLIGFGLRRILVRMNKGFKELLAAKIKEDYHRSITRLIIIDMEVLPLDQPP